MNSPNICVWFHEESGEFSPSAEKIAFNFTEFLNQLHV